MRKTLLASAFLLSTLVSTQMGLAGPFGPAAANAPLASQFQQTNNNQEPTTYYKVAFLANQLDRADFGKKEWIPAKLMLADSSENPYFIVRMMQNGEVKSVKAYLASNGRGELFAVLRDPDTLRLAAVEGVVRLTTVAALENQGLRLEPSRKYGAPQPNDPVYEIAWLKQPYALKEPENQG